MFKSTSILTDRWVGCLVLSILSMLIRTVASGEASTFPIQEEVAKLESATINLDLNFSEKALNVAFDFPSTDADAIEFSTSKWGGVDDFHTNFSSIAARDSEGSKLDVADLSDGHWRIVNGGKPFTLTYKVTHDKPTFMAGRYGHHYPTLMDDWAFLWGHAYLMRPDDPRLMRMPVQTTIDAGDYKKVYSSWDSEEPVNDLAKLLDSLLIAGNYRTQVSQLERTKLTVAIQGKWKDTDSTINELIKKVAIAQASYMQQPPASDLLVVLVPGEPNSQGGTAVDGAIALHPSPEFAMSDQGSPAIQLLAHEHFHLWVGRMLRASPKQKDGYYHWFHEGCVEYYSWLTMYREGMLTEAEFVQRINQAIVELELNPVASTTTAELLSENYWRNSDYNKLPYIKGAIVSFLIDTEIRRLTDNQRNIDHFVRGLIDHTSQGSKPYDDEMFVRVLNQLTGDQTEVDWKSFIKRFTIDADPLPIKEWLGRADLEITTKETPVFDLGFETDKPQLQKNATVTSVDLNSAAEKAGLKIGDIVTGIDLYHGDPNRQASFNVTRGGEAIDVSFVPSRQFAVVQIDNSKHNQMILNNLFLTSSAKTQTKLSISKAEAIEDLKFMLATIEQVHMNPYWKISKEEFDRTMSEEVATFDESVPLKDFILAAMRLVALIGEGHTSVNHYSKALKPELAKYQFLPVQMKLDSQGKLRVTRIADQAFGVSVGDEVISINGQNAIGLFQDAIQLGGGSAAMRNEYCEWFFLYRLFLADFNTPFRVHIRRSQSELNVDLPVGLDVDAFNRFIKKGGTEEDYNFTLLPDKIGLIRYNSCNDKNKFEAFCKSAFSRIRTEKIEKLIIDIRRNSGGDSSLNHVLLSFITRKPYRQGSGRQWKVSRQMKELMKTEKYHRFFGKQFCDSYISKNDGDVISEVADKDDLIEPQKREDFFSGKVCLLTSPYTFSSANMLADAVKTFEIATIIGQPTGQSTNGFGEQLRFQLPNSKLFVFSSTTFDLGADADERSHHPVIPDIEVKGLDAKDKDRVLTQAIEWLNSEANCVDQPLREDVSEVVVSPTVELALVIAALSPLGVDDENYDPIDRESNYFKSVANYFADYKNHRAILALGGEYNLPRLVGNAADFKFDELGRLVEQNSDGSLWNDRRNDIFRNNLELIQQFANESKFLTFFAANKKFYHSLKEATNQLVEIQDQQKWLEARFSTRRRPPVIYISRLLYGHHWTSGHRQETLRIWARPPDPDKVAETGIVSKMEFAGQVFTELDHAYVNPISEKHANQIKESLSNRDIWATDKAWKSYPSQKLVFNEYMTHAVFLMYAQDRISAEDFAVLEKRVSKRMNSRRGFVSFDCFSETFLKLYDQQQEKRIELLFEPMLDWCTSQRAKQ